MDFLVTKPCDAIRHLVGIASKFATTSRFRIHYLRSGPDQGEAVVFLHGNGASSTWWEETMITLPPAFRAIAPDLRGYGLSDRSALIDATRGVQDWVDDLYALLVSVDRFHLVGHSLGGLTSWGVMADSRASGRLRTVTVVAPGPPCGFGGVHGESGLPNNPDFAGSGGGLVHPRFRVLTTSARKPPLRTDKFAALGRIAAPVHPIRR
jgi:pimeloyl-ACP methyl ester carboxylesterase